jgi:hypothetical protein
MAQPSLSTAIRSHHLLSLWRLYARKYTHSFASLVWTNSNNAAPLRTACQRVRSIRPLARPSELARRGVQRGPAHQQAGYPELGQRSACQALAMAADWSAAILLFALPTLASAVVGDFSLAEFPIGSTCSILTGRGSRYLTTDADGHRRSETARSFPTPGFWPWHPAWPSERAHRSVASSRH